MKTKLNIKSVSRLLDILSISEFKLNKICNNFSLYVRTKEIITKKGKKRSVIDLPPYIKDIQRKVLHLLYSTYVHSATHGWKKGKSIKTNAERHCGNPAKLCLDLKHCFPNIHSTRVRKLFEVQLGCSKLISNYLTKLTTYNYHLPQGFVTSGALLNIIFLQLDIALARLAKKYSLVFSRYGDDISFSGRYIHPGMVHIIKKKISQFGLKLNSSKEEFTNGEKAVLITGLNTNGKKLKVPRTYKRNLRAQTHNIKTAPFLENKKIQKSIDGKINYINYVET